MCWSLRQMQKSNYSKFMAVNLIMKNKIFILVSVLLVIVLSACATGTPIPPTELPGTSLFNDSPSSATPPSNGSPPLAASPSNDSPPPATLTINGTVQTAGIGTYCWTTTPGKSAEVCVDKVGVPTAREPLHSSSPVTGSTHSAFE